MENITQSKILGLEKQVDTFKGKRQFLLAKDKDGIKYWLGEATWDCGWYWGFGYISTYERNRIPSNANDIDSHEHWDTSIIGKREEYNYEKSCFELSRDYIHHINQNKKFVDTVLTDNESWELSELMKSFYILKETAEFYKNGSANITNNPCSKLLKNTKEYERINKILLPAIFEEIYKIITPNN